MDRSLIEHYRNLYEQYGDGPQAVQHSSQEQQYRRFDFLFEIDSEINSVLDVGCGLGDMYAYMQQRDIRAKYGGVDFLDLFVERGAEKYGNCVDVQFYLADIINEEDPLPKGYDFVMLSGVFHNRSEHSEADMKNTIRKMYDACERGVAFNALSKYVDYQDAHLFYTDPLAVFDYCKREITARVCLRHDYELKSGVVPFEYTIFLYR